MSWRDQLRNGYPWMPLAFAAVMLVLVIAVIISMLTVLPAERDAIEHGTTTTGHAVAYRQYHRNLRSWTYEANVTWQDAQNQHHEEKGLGISERAYNLIGDGKDVEVKYLGDRAVIVADLEHRVRDESNAPFVLGLFAIALLMGVYHWRRRLREWRAPRPVQW